MKAVRFELKGLEGGEGARGPVPVDAKLRFLQNFWGKLVTLSFADEQLEAKFRRCYWNESRYRLTFLGWAGTMVNLMRTVAGAPTSIISVPGQH